MGPSGLAPYNWTNCLDVPTSRKYDTWTEPLNISRSSSKFSLPSNFPHVNPVRISHLPHLPPQHTTCPSHPTLLQFVTSEDHPCVNTVLIFQRFGDVCIPLSRVLLSTARLSVPYIHISKSLITHYISSLHAVVVLASNLNTVSGMHKYWVPYPHGDHTLYGGAWYMWVLSMELASCHHSDAYDFEVTPRLLENSCAPVGY